MTVAQQIVEHAGALFDVGGATRLTGGDNLLIMGLESTAERDLDAFGHVAGVFKMYGFEEYIGPRLEPLLNFICSLGFSAEPAGRFGYPLKGEINLENEAIRAGLGKRGRSTVVLHSQYGPRLRFAAIRTDVPLEVSLDTSFTEEENPVCDGCSICIDVCPPGVLEPYRMLDASLCLSNISLVDEDGRSILCDKSLELCPAADKYHNFERRKD